MTVMRVLHFIIYHNRLAMLCLCKQAGPLVVAFLASLPTISDWIVSRPTESAEQSCDDQPASEGLRPRQIGPTTNSVLVPMMVVRDCALAWLCFCLCKRHVGLITVVLKGRLPGEFCRFCEGQYSYALARREC